MAATSTVLALFNKGDKIIISSKVYGGTFRVLDKVFKNLGITYGLTITAIKNGKMKDAGATKGTIILQVNDQKMETVEDWEEAVKSANQSSERTLWIKAITPAGRKTSYVIDLNE